MNMGCACDNCNLRGGLGCNLTFQGNNLGGINNLNTPMLGPPPMLDWGEPVDEAEQQIKRLKKHLKRHPKGSVIVGYAADGIQDLRNNKYIVTLKIPFESETEEGEDRVEVFLTMENKGDFARIYSYEEQIIVADAKTLEIIEIVGL